MKFWQLMKFTNNNHREILTKPWKYECEEKKSATQENRVDATEKNKCMTNGNLWKDET